MAQTTRKKATPVEAVETVETPVVQKTTKTKPAAKKIAIKQDTLIDVRSNFAGTLIYISKRTNEEVRWSDVGEINIMPYSELETMRNTQRQFFTNNWIKLVGEEGKEAIKQLRLEAQYENFVDLENIDEYLELSKEEIVAKISPMNRDIKDMIATKVSTMIQEGTLESLSTIKAFEEAVGYKLLED